MAISGKSIGAAAVRTRRNRCRRMAARRVGAGSIPASWGWPRRPGQGSASRAVSARRRRPFP